MNLRICIRLFTRCLRRSIRPGNEKRLGNLQSHREEILRSVRRHLGKETDIVTLPIQHDSAANWRSRWM